MKPKRARPWSSAFARRIPSASSPRWSRCRGARALAGCASMTAPFDTWHAVHQPVRRVQARHQPGQLPFAGHGRQAEGRPDQAAGARWCSARRSSPARSATTAGTTSTSTARTAGSQTRRQFTVYFKDDALARWEGDEMPQSVQELNRTAATRSLPDDPYGEDAGFIGKVIDLFNKHRQPIGASRFPDHGRGPARHRRRRRPDGPGADRGRRSRSPVSRSPRRWMSAAARQWAATPANDSAAPPASSSATTFARRCAAPTS